jgi:hypothetical protein
LNNLWINKNKTQKVYDINNFLIEEKSLTWNTNTTWENDVRDIYFYTSSGNIFTHHHFPDYFGGTWHLEREILYIYNLADQLIGWDNYCYGPCGPSHGTYGYYSDGNFSWRFIESETMGGIESEYKSNWYYLTYPNSDSLYVFVSSDIEKCSNDSAEIYAFTFGGNAPINYQWSPPIGLDSVNVLNPTTIAVTSTLYTLTLTDDLGNTVSDDIDVQVYPIPNPIIFIQSVDTTSICNSAILATDSVSWLRCQWYFNGALQSNPFGIYASHFLINENGTYIVKSVNQSGCENYDTLQVSFFSNPAPAISTSNDCELVIATSVNAISFQWYKNGIPIPGEINDTLNILPIGAGSYEVSVEDINGCANFSDLLYYNPLSTSISTYKSCVDSCSGKLIVNVAGGTTPYQYQWSSGDTINTTEQLCSGLYSVLITDVNGCTISSSDSITEFNTFDYSIIASTTNSFTACDAVAYVSFSAPINYYRYTIIWNNNISNYITNLCAGWNYVEVKHDLNGCSKIDSIFIVSNPFNDNCSISYNYQNPTCPGSSDGWINATSIGTGPASYIWNTLYPATTSLIDDLNSGIYQVIMVDSIGCSDTASISLFDPDSMEVQFDILSANPNLPCSTLVKANVITGTPPFFYNWSTGATGKIVYLCPGIHTLTLIGNGCYQEFTINIPSSLTACSFNPIIHNATDSVICDGSASLTLYGTSPFSINWAMGQIDPIITSQCPGTYYFSVTDSLGCSFSDSVTIGINSTVNINTTDKTTLVKVFPNPFSDFTRINFNQKIIKSYVLEITDATGKTIKQFSNLTQEFLLYKNELSEGIYLYHLKNHNQIIYSGKLIIN